MDKKTKVITYIIILVILIILIGIAVLTKFSSEAPNVMAIANSGINAQCIRTGYEWNAFGKKVVVDALSPLELTYQNENILLVQPGEEVNFYNSGRDYEAYQFYQEDIRYYDEKENEVVLTDVPALMDSKYMTVVMPETLGTYIYSFTLNYGKKGTAQYALKVVVSDAPSYKVDDIIKYKDTYLGNASKVNQLLGALPYHKYKDGIILRTVNEPYELIVYYKDVKFERETILNNTVALFALIPNVDIITYQLDESTIIYTRDEVENLFGRDLLEYANDTNLWETEVLYKGKKVERDLIAKYSVLMKECISKISAEYITVDFTSLDKFDAFSLSETEKRELIKSCASSKKVLVENTLEATKTDENWKGVLLYVENISESDGNILVDMVEYHSEKKQEKRTYEISADGVVTQK